jgi:hypothetical protein
VCRLRSERARRPGRGQGWGRGGEGQAGVPKGIIALLSPGRRNDRLSEIDGYHVPVTGITFQLRDGLLYMQAAPRRMQARYMQALDMQALGAGLPGSGVRAGSSLRRYTQRTRRPAAAAISPRHRRNHARLRRAASAFTRVFDVSPARLRASLTCCAGERLGMPRKRRLPVVGYGRYATVRYGMVDDRRVGS